MSLRGILWKTVISRALALIKYDKVIAFLFQRLIKYLEKAIKKDDSKTVERVKSTIDHVNKSVAVATVIIDGLTDEEEGMDKHKETVAKVIKVGKERLEAWANGDKTPEDTEGVLEEKEEPKEQIKKEEPVAKKEAKKNH